MIEVEVSNRSGATVDEAGAVALARVVLESEGVDDGELGVTFVGPGEMRSLKHEHLGIDEVTDVLSFPIDGIAFVRFTNQDVVRHKLVQRIVEAYKEHADQTGTTRSR